MRHLLHVYSMIVRWQYRRLSRYLETVSPALIETEGHRRVLKALRQAQRHVPAFKKLYRQKNVDIHRVSSIEDFKTNVPVIDKENHFQDAELTDLCKGDGLKNVQLFYSSSGSSGVFSFGAETRSDPSESALEIEFMLNDAVQIFKNDTLVVNCLPMGVKIHTRTLPLIESGTRVDVVIALLKKLKDQYRQFVIIGEQLFLKKLFEDGATAGVPWKELTIHIVTGAEYVAENYRTYIGALLGHDFQAPEKGSMVVNFGLSEVSNSIGRETPETISIRRLAHSNPDFRKILFGDNAKICPNILQYHPYQTFLETLDGDQGSLVVTTPSLKRTFPLIRYNTKDRAQVLSYDHLKTLIHRFDPSLPMPKFKLPFVIVWGKFKPLLSGSGKTIFPEEIKESLYENFEIANKITGCFRLQLQDGNPTLLIQLCKNQEVESLNSEHLKQILRKYTSADLAIQVYKFENYPYGFEQNFEKKASYLD